MENFIKQKIKQIKKGDQSAFGEIATFYQHKVFQICYRMIGNLHEAEDLAQEAFVRAYTNIHTFDEKRKFSTWIYRIATNLSIDRIRTKKPDYYLDAEIQGSEGLNMYSQVSDDKPLPDEEVESLELLSYLQNQIQSLPDKYRAVITLRYVEELSLQEISEILDLPLGTVKTRIHRGREALRKKLRDL
jgi:RNA polymerase sigma-70 factor, ECF subfamily